MKLLFKKPSNFLNCVLAAIFACAMQGAAHADLVGYWSLDGDADADAGGWGASTVVSGTNGENDISYPADVPAAIATRVSQSLAFDANNDDRVVTAFQAGVAGLSGTPATTISFWIKRSAGTTSDRSLVYLGGSTASAGTAISMERSGGNLAGKYFNGTTPSNGGFNADQWMHVVLTYETNHGGAKIYFDGVDVTGTTVSPANILTVAADATFALGDRSDGAAPANSFQIAELAVWYRVLSQFEIADLASGSAPTEIPLRDCDNDGIDDREQLIEYQQLDIGPWYPSKMPLDNDQIEGTPEVDGIAVSVPAAPALSDVTLTLQSEMEVWASGSDPTQYLLVYLNGAYFGRFLEHPGENTLVVPQATWETLRNGEDSIDIAIEFSAAISQDDIDFFPPGNMWVSYTLDRDVNDNGWLDDCIPDGDPSGPDSDGDGVSDSIDRSPHTIADPSLVDAYGQLLRVARFDADGDGDVDVNDFDLLDAAARDVDGDGDIDLHDTASILHGARGPGVAADPAFLQELQLFKAHTPGPEDLDIKPWYKALSIDYTRWYSGPELTGGELDPKYPRYSGPYAAPQHFIYASELAWRIYGTHLASIDTTEAQGVPQLRQIQQLKEVTAASGSRMSWIGLRWSRADTSFKWQNGQHFSAQEGSLSYWIIGGQVPTAGYFTPGKDDYFVYNAASEGYHWLNGDGATASLEEQAIEGFVAQLPVNTVPAAPVATTETVTVTLDSSLDGQVVAPGQTVDWTISFEVSSGDNSGLALLVADLEQDAANPATFDLPVADAAPTAMANFDVPLGFTGPGGFDGQQTGDAGALNLAQIGGSQNTLGAASSDTTHGQGTTVVTGLGQSGSTVFATGSFTAPATTGTYTFNLSNTLASVLKTVGGAGEGSEIVPANITLAQGSISFDVSTPPVITLLGDDPVTHEAATPYIDAGATASDAEDGDLTGSIVVANGVDPNALGSYTVTYNVTDSAGATAPELTRTVNVVDTTAPVITLLGNNPVTIEVGDTYTDAGATALDSLEGNLTASVVMSGNIDNQTPGSYVLTYNVSDSSVNAATPVTRTVIVDDNDPPAFANATVSLTVDEGTTGVVYQAIAIDPDDTVLDYSLGTIGDEGFFSIDPVTGQLSLNATLRFETPQDANGDNVYAVQVLASDSEGLNDTQVVQITINNTNIAPVITGNLVDPIPENTGFYVYDFTVADADTLPASLIMYTDDSRFDISPDGSGGYRLHRKSGHNFNYENIPTYSFNLVVSDGVEMDTVPIVFTLTNENDSPPVAIFTSAGPVTENNPGAVVGTLAITDADGPTTFYFDLDLRFEVAADGVTVKLKDGVSLDYEEASSFVLPIIVWDEPLGSADGNFDELSPTITVLDVNDVAPSNVQLSANQVTENDTGALIGTLNASDADGPTLSFSVSDARFEVDGTTLKLLDGLSLDRETTPSIPITVTASDGTFQTPQAFTITVLNVDEGGPENLALSNASVPENTTGVIGTLSATDPDGDAITFTENDSRVAISGTTLSLTTAINHESLADGTISVDITATAAGVSTTETFLITIEDVNEAPVLTMNLGAITDLTGTITDLPTLENVRQVTVFFPGDPLYPISLVSNDVDGDALTYVLGGADAAAFTVDPATGALNFVISADYESPADANSDGTYEITVTVTDGSLSSNTITLGLDIVDTVDEIDTTVESRWVFYNNSAWDGEDAAAGVNDDAAIATDKSALLPGGVATFANYTSYSKGINGIMVDIAGLPGTPTASDFTFRTGNDNDPTGWASASDPSIVSVRAGAGTGGSDRVTLIWNDNDLDASVDANEAVAKAWLEVTMKATANTGLSSDEVFYFGNAVGETGNDASSARVNTADVLLIRNNPKTFLDPAEITDPNDLNRDTKVNTQDRLLARNHKTTFLDELKLIDLSGGASSTSFEPADTSLLRQTGGAWGAAMGMVDGRSVLTFQGPAGAGYEVYASPRVEGGWELLSGEIIETGPGRFQLDHAPAEGGSLFYKIVPVIYEEDDVFPSL